MKVYLLFPAKTANRQDTKGFGFDWEMAERALGFSALGLLPLVYCVSWNNHSATYGAIRYYTKM